VAPNRTPGARRSLPRAVVQGRRLRLAAEPPRQGTEHAAAAAPRHRVGSGVSASTCLGGDGGGESERQLPAASIEYSTGAPGVVMTGKSEQKSRKQRRKEARSEKQKLRFLSWVQHQGGKKKKLAMPAVEPNPEEGKKMKKEPATVKKKRKRELEGKHKPKSNFQEYLEMEMGGAVSMEEDLEMERRLAKKLKVKKGKFGRSG